MKYGFFRFTMQAAFTGLFAMTGCASMSGSLATKHADGVRGPSSSGFEQVYQPFLCSPGTGVAGIKMTFASADFLELTSGNFTGGFQSTHTMKVKNQTVCHNAQECGFLFARTHATTQFQSGYELNAIEPYNPGVVLTYLAGKTADGNDQLWLVSPTVQFIGASNFCPASN